MVLHFWVMNPHGPPPNFDTVEYEIVVLTPDLGHIKLKWSLTGHASRLPQQVFHSKMLPCLVTLVQ